MIVLAMRHDILNTEMRSFSHSITSHLLPPLIAPMSLCLPPWPCVCLQSHSIFEQASLEGLWEVLLGGVLRGLGPGLGDLLNRCGVAHVCRCSFQCPEGCC